MNVNIKTLVLEAIKETLRVAQCQTQKQRPINNLDAESICYRFLTEKEEALTHGTDSYGYWLTAFIESDVGLDEACELDELVAKLKGGFTSGFDSGESGQYCFDVYALAHH
ncbi:hypothetical protein GL272_19690 [Aeromonas veronii]|uniref:hypothetical protein n=1 Tax=Aeromonas TaxID=642 RepID=UPI000744AF1B|nr:MULTISPECIES: hypothetical protein [Aeromonas]ALZ82526.1 hypothetical protein AhyD4_23210 [Aeromonas hydrophila]MBW3762692.1 hypothetical protein [Aeromonas jandaei]MBW3779099.1 hypothetical protein [Aeromonas veronii]QGW99206.1 hypothetical protein FGM04_22005 [Aeromonas veronii]